MSDVQIIQLVVLVELLCLFALSAYSISRGGNQISTNLEKPERSFKKTHTRLP